MCFCDFEFIKFKSMCVCLCVWACAILVVAWWPLAAGRCEDIFAFACASCMSFAIYIYISRAHGSWIGE